MQIGFLEGKLSESSPILRGGLMSEDTARFGITMKVIGVILFAMAFVAWLSHLKQTSQGCF